MSDYMTKFNLCVLPTQCGKTFTAISKINTYIQEDNEFGKSIHIIFTMNTLLNNSQFVKRLNVLQNTYGKDAICVVSSKKSELECKHVKNKDGLQSLCFDKKTCPKVIVMCSNSIRRKDGVDFLECINDNSNSIKRAFVYYDELHDYINDKVRSQIEKIHDLDIVKGITALTASPDKIWKDTGFWSNLRLIYLDNLSYENYAGYKDMIFNCIDDYFEMPYIRRSNFDQQTYEFIKQVLIKHPEILGKNTYSFIPAHIRCRGHDSVSDLILKLNNDAVVVVINGTKKIIKYKDCNRILIEVPLKSKNEEVCETISRLVIDHNLQNHPIVITGFLCIGMGQTFTNKTLGSFTSAIFGHLDLDNDKMYQLFGRITGRIKDWVNYRQTKVYCPTIIMNRCLTMEECSRDMALNHNGENVSHEDYIKPMNQMGEIGQAVIENIRIQRKSKVVKEKCDDPLWDLIERDFETLDDANKFLKENKCRQKKTVKKDDNGFIISSITKKKCVLCFDDVKKEISNWKNTSGFDLKETTTEASRMIISYRDIKDNTTTVFTVRIIKKK
jgi:hypothetical protein